jgi:hypothetical protein
MRWATWIGNKKCNVRVFTISLAYHIVCRYEFIGEGYSVVAKFYAEPTGWKRSYNPAKAMEREFQMLRKIERIIDVPRPIALRKDFSCVLVTEYIPGKPFYRFMKTENGLYDRLTAVAHMLRKLHDKSPKLAITSRMSSPILTRFWISSSWIGMSASCTIEC